VGVTGICNALNFNNKNNPIDNIIYTINGIFRGIFARNKAESIDTLRCELM
jgi:hypothetical protein